MDLVADDSPCQGFSMAGKRVENDARNQLVFSYIKFIEYVQPVKYVSIFLFRNGFRILPFGELGDDSWGLNQQAQQGYNRHLGTRDLFGRVDIQTNNIDEFKESTSRDGGLIESETTIELFRLFKNIYKRLERYITGVLWGEGFLKKEYFKNKSDVNKNRELLRKDNTYRLT